MRGFVAYTESFTIQNIELLLFAIHFKNVFVAILMMRAECLIKRGKSM